MAAVFTSAFILYYLSSIVVCQSGNDGSFEIVRGKHDTFRNLQCQESRNCIQEQCGIYEAKCVNDECKRCRCHKIAGTFLVSGSRSGKCTKDEDIIPESVPEKSFLLKNIKYQRCLTSQNGTIVGTNCPSSSLIDMRWMLIKHDEYFKLLSVGTLQCLEFLQPSCGYNSYDTGNVTLKTCNRTDGQKIQSNGEATNSISSIFECRPYRKQYYNLGLLEKTNNDVPAYLAASIRNANQGWSNNGVKLNDRNITTYTGCYRFRNEHFMLYLDNDTTCQTNPCSHQFSAPIFMEHTECGVDWTNSTILPYDGVMWENITEYFSKNIVKNLAYIKKRPSENSKVLIIKQEALERFNGALVKLSISCNNKSTDENEKHCLLLKFKSPPPANKMENMGPTKVSTTETTTETTAMKLPCHKDGETSSINPLVIAVPVSLLAVILVLTLVYFVWYRKRRFLRSRKSNTDNQDAPSALNMNTETELEPAVTAEYASLKRREPPSIYEPLTKNDSNKSPEVNYVSVTEEPPIQVPPIYHVPEDVKSKEKTELEPAVTAEYASLKRREPPSIYEPLTINDSKPPEVNYVSVTEEPLIQVPPIYHVPEDVRSKEKTKLEPETAEESPGEYASLKQNREPPPIYQPLKKRHDSEVIRPLFSTPLEQYEQYDKTSYEQVNCFSVTGHQEQPGKDQPIYHVPEHLSAKEKTELEMETEGDSPSEYASLKQNREPPSIYQPLTKKQ